MEVLKSGIKQVDEPWWWVGREVKCPNCDFEGKLTKNDGKDIHTFDHNNGVWIRCPECGACLSTNRK